MSPKTLGALAGTTGVAILLAVWATRGPATGDDAADAGSKPGGTSTGASGQAPTTGALFPVLATRISDVSEISVKSKDSEVVLKRSDAKSEGKSGGKDGAPVWMVTSKSNYPADANKVRDAVVSLNELRVVDHKTQKPENYAFLGVTDPESKDSPSRLVTLKDAAGQVLVGAVLGNTVAAAGAPKGETRTNIYLRRAGEAQAYQAEGRLDPRASFDPDALSWLDRDVISVDAARVKSVTITHADGSRTRIEKESRDAKDFVVLGIPAGRELKYAGAASPTGGALSRVNLDDVMPIQQASEGASPTGSAEFFTFDGLVVTVETSTKGGTGWATFAARYEEPDIEPVPSNQPPPAATDSAEKQKKADEIKNEADDLNRKASAWAYALPEFKLKQFQTTVDEMLKPLDAPKSEAQPEPGVTLPGIVPEK